MLGNLVSAFVGLGVSLLNAINQRGSGMVWLNVVIYAGLAAGFGYFQLARRDLTTHVGTRPGTPIPH